MVKISVYSAGCDNLIADEWYLQEGVRSALKFADEVVIGLTFQDAKNFDPEPISDVRVRIFSNRWEPRMFSHMYALQKTLALSKCTGDVCILMDADEVFHEEDAAKIRELAEWMVRNSVPAVDFRVIHFWRDFGHTLMTAYHHKTYMVRNGLGIFHGKHPDPSSDESDAHVAFNHQSLYSVLPQDAPTVYHYGHVRTPSTYLRKKNRIERMHHPDWADLTSWSFDMKDAVRYSGGHPAVMKDRIAAFKVVP